MKWQFQAEAHNRQNKAKKPDYRGEMIERSRSEGPTAMQRVLASSYPKIEAKRDWVRKIRRFRFFLNGMQYRIGWSIDHFAKINGLPPAEKTTKAVFDTIRESAADDMQLIEPAIMKGTAIPRRLFGGMIMVWDIEFEAPTLRCDEVKR
jgi:hypothetical protein